MTETIEYYELERVSKELKKGCIVTACCRVCDTCGTMISGMGGPGSGSICVPCGDVLRSGQARSVIDWSQQTKEK